MRDEAERIEVKDRTAWRRWLRRHHDRPTGVWLVIAKKGRPGLPYGPAVEEALCFGWIDSTAGRLDDDRYLIWMAPRKPRSVWSAVNKRRVAVLIREGRMTDAGRAAIRVAKRNGSWDALRDSDALIVPEDLAAALGADRRAKAHWDAFPPSSRKMILAWIGSAKGDGTRRRRIDEAVRMAAENVRAPFARPQDEPAPGAVKRGGDRAGSSEPRPRGSRPSRGSPATT
jgi:uncharacterized protein YdeI (YjbR/CyaY-like superfamily)